MALDHGATRADRPAGERVGPGAARAARALSARVPPRRGRHGGRPPGARPATAAPSPSRCCGRTWRTTRRPAGASSARSTRSARITSDRVAAVIDSDISGDRPYLVTRYVAGPSLDDVVLDEGPLTPARARRRGARARRGPGGDPLVRGRAPRPQAGQRPARGRPAGRHRLRHRAHRRRRAPHQQRAGHGHPRLPLTRGHRRLAGHPGHRLVGLGGDPGLRRVRPAAVRAGTHGRRPRPGQPRGGRPHRRRRPPRPAAGGGARARPAPPAAGARGGRRARTVCRGVARHGPGAGGGPVGRRTPAVLLHRGPARSRRESATTWSEPLAPRRRRGRRLRGAAAADVARRGTRRTRPYETPDGADGGEDAGVGLAGGVGGRPRRARPAHRPGPAHRHPPRLRRRPHRGRGDVARGGVSSSRCSGPGPPGSATGRSPPSSCAATATDGAAPTCRSPWPSARGTSSSLRRSRSSGCSCPPSSRCRRHSARRWASRPPRRRPWAGSPHPAPRLASRPVRSSPGGVRAAPRCAAGRARWCAGSRLPAPSRRSSSPRSSSAAVVLAALAVARHGHLVWWPFPWTLGTS